MMRRRGPGIARGIARTAVVAGTASVVAGQVRHHQDQKWANQEQQQYEQQVQAEQAAAYQQQQAAASQQPAPAAEPDYMAELEKLAQLKNQGVITEDEFQAKKAQILGI
jgi:putative oligomerization/nucleic acid binding protein/uncharacterized protein DUF3824